MIETPDHPVRPLPSHIFLLSARDEAVLRRAAAQLLEHLETLPPDTFAHALPKVAYTLQVGRDAMPVRMLLRAGDGERLRAELRRRLASSEPIGSAAPANDVLGGADDFLQRAADAAMTMGDPDSAADLWVKGARVDWNRFYGEARPGRAHLPTYPFKLERFWITESRGRHGAPLPTDRAPPAPSDPPSASETPMSAEILPAHEIEPGAGSVPAPAQPVMTTERAGATEDGLGKALAEPAGGAAVVARPLAEACMTLGKLQDELSQGLAAALFMNPADIDLDETFFELGVESVSGVEWIRSLGDRYGVTIKVSAIYDYPTLRRFAEFLYEQMGPTAALPPSSAALPQTRPALPPNQPAAQQAVSRPDTAVLSSITTVLANLLGLPEEAFYPELRCEDLGLNPEQGAAFAAFLAERGIPEVGEGATLSQLAARIAEAAPIAAAPAPASFTASSEADAAAAAAATFAVGTYALVVEQPTLPEDARFAARPVVPPDAGEVAIEVHASAVNYPDVLALAGRWPPMSRGAFIPGCEVAGVVVELGAGVEGLRPGDRVIAVLGPAGGGHAGRVISPAGQVVRIPATLDFDKACGLPMAFLAAERALEAGEARPGETMLLHAALGGLGLMALQLAALRGVSCFPTSREISKRWKLKLMGLESSASYRLGVGEALRSWTQGRGVDLVFNSIPEAAQDSAGVLAPGGRFLDLAPHAPASARVPSIAPIVIDALGREPEAMIAQRLRRLVAWVEEGRIVPITTRVYPRSQLGEALACVARGEHVGRVVISHVADAASTSEDAVLAAVAAQLAAAKRAAAGVGTGPTSTGAERPPAQPEAPVALESGERTAALEPIAVIGLAARFPMAPDADAFWDNLVNGRDCVTGLPLSRWNMGEYADTAEVRALYPHMGQLEEADMFDPLFFGISPKEARLMDPQQRIFLQACWTSIEEAGYAPSRLAGGRCGVFAGCSGAGYGFGAKMEASTHVLMGHSNSILPARVAYHLDLKGPCLAIDTACSSALVAIADACTSLATGGCDLALAGGVQVFASPMFAMMATEGGMLSADGRCFTFDSRANGFVPGEGVGVVLLKRLSEAERDGDQIHGVIRAWGINHDGRTNGMTAPSVVSQAALERDVYSRFGIDPATIGFVEAHGTGTRLGDPIEVEALTSAFRSFTQEQGFCALSSVKSNIGHTLAAAGAAGLLKVLLAMRHRTLPPSINYSEQNAEIEIVGTPFYVNNRARPWTPTRGTPLRAAVSSFSYNGTNAHVVIDAPTPRPPPPSSVGLKGHPILLSAKSDEQLTAQAAQLLRHVDGVLSRGEPDPATYLRDLAYTLQVGRDGMVERVGFLVTSLSSLCERLRQIASGDMSGVGRANVRAARRRLDGERPSEAAQRARRVEDAFTAGDPDTLVAAWLEGVEIDWARLYFDAAPRRISLPTYPFAKRRFWFSDSPPERLQIAAAPTLRPATGSPESLAGLPAEPAVDPLSAEFNRLLGQLEQA